MSTIVQAIETGKTVLGIELGSTRIKAVLIGEDHAPIASGSFEWENKLEDGAWVYHLADVWLGVQCSFRDLARDVQNKYHTSLVKVGAMGVSAMMHGYLAVDKNGEQLAPFRTWRNTITEKAAEMLTEAFAFNIPQRWSVAHLYQSILNGEKHVADIAYMTTLAGYVHWRLTGEKVLGVGDASGMFPIDSQTNGFHAGMLQVFDGMIAEHGFPWELRALLPKVLCAGEYAGILTKEGALLLDPTGDFCPGVPLCPPEGDAGTGMVATNSVAQRTGNVSAGTSIFAMLVLERPLSKVYMEIDMVTTPSGKPVAMVHCNSFTSDLDAWINLFGEAAAALGTKPDRAALYAALYNRALEADMDCGGLLAYNYYSGEPITGLDEGRPLFVRPPDGRFTLPNLMRTLLFSAMATLRVGMNILTDRENMQMDQILGHGGLFKTKGVGQRLMAAALNVPVTVMSSAGEGGAWGIALLAAYLLRKEANEALEEYLAKRVFGENAGERMQPLEADVHSFENFMVRYMRGLPIEQAAVDHMPQMQ